MGGLRGTPIPTEAVLCYIQCIEFEKQDSSWLTYAVEEHAVHIRGVAQLNPFCYNTIGDHDRNVKVSQEHILFGNQSQKLVTLTRPLSQERSRTAHREINVKPHGWK